MSEEEKNPLRQLQRWYASHCNGEWERTHGVSVVTTSNPGWSVRVDIRDSKFDAKRFAPLRTEDYDSNDRDWVECKLSPAADEFWGVGDETKLEVIISWFLKWTSE